MAGEHRLTLQSEYGDETLHAIKFVVHGTANFADAQSVMSGGLKFYEGRPTVSTNLVHAFDWTVNPQKHINSLGGGTAPNGEPGRVIVCAVPSHFYLGYGVFTTAYVEGGSKRVLGAPLRYAAGRKQLAFYSSPETGQARDRIQAEVLRGFTLEQHPQFVLGPEHIVGWFENVGVLKVLTTQLDVSIRALETVDIPRLVASLKEIFIPRIPAEEVLATPAMQAIVNGTIESIILSRLRMMRWQNLRLLGYHFWEGQEEVQIGGVASLQEQQHQIDELGRRLASSALFNGDLAWLKKYATHVMEMMRLEQEAAALESTPD